VPFPWLVIDRFSVIDVALAHPSIGDLVKQLYPEITLRKPPRIGPLPPDPPPTPLVLPLGEQASLPRGFSRC
jgi:hypothetical protein